MAEMADLPRRMSEPFKDKHVVWSKTKVEPGCKEPRELGDFRPMAEKVKSTLYFTIIQTG